MCWLKLLMLIALTAVASSCYAVAHELLHYLVALLLGYSARISITRHIVPCLCVKIRDDIPLPQKCLILFTPYVLNAALLIMPLHSLGLVMLKIIAVLTLPNIVLEFDSLRNKLGVLSASYMAVMLLALTLIQFKIIT